MSDILKFIGGLLAIFAVVIGVLFGWSLIMAFPVKWLWNYTLPTLFNFPVIGYWQAFCLLLLSGLLFRANVNKQPSINND